MPRQPGESARDWYQRSRDEFNRVASNTERLDEHLARAEDDLLDAYEAWRVEDPTARE